MKLVDREKTLRKTNRRLARTLLVRAQADDLESVATDLRPLDRIPGLGGGREEICQFVAGRELGLADRRPLVR
jgi:hypothetical protein